MEFENFLELIKALISKHSDEKYNFILFLNDDQKYSSEAFDFDYDYRLNFDTHDSVTILLRRNTDEGFYDVGKATFYIRTAYEILDSECWKICKRNDAVTLHRTKLSEFEDKKRVWLQLYKKIDINLANNFEGYMISLNRY